MAIKKYYIGWRENRAQTGGYYIGYGQISKQTADLNAYGVDEVTAYNTEAEYLAALQQLKNENKNIINTKYKNIRNWGTGVTK